jgi:hypothetical protein
MGGIAVAGNLLCVTWSLARGHVFLFDVESRQRVSSWTTPPGPRGYSDAAGVAMDEHCQLFVADPHNDRVARYTPFGQFVGEVGRPARGESVRERKHRAALDRPHAVAVHAGVVHVAGGDRPRQRAVRRFTVDGRALVPLASGGDPGASFGAPRGIWADEHGVLVADTLRSAVQSFRRDGTFVREFRPDEALLATRPAGVVRLPDGRLLVVEAGDHERLLVVGGDGRWAELPSGGAVLPTAPVAVTVDRRGRPLVLDRGGERVLRLSVDLRDAEVLLELEEHDLDAPPPRT